MFIGEYNYSVDDKGRLAVPAKFRSSLKTGAVVTRGIDNCLFVYSKTEWTTLAKKLSSLPISQANTRAFSRLMLAGAMDADMDKQGRIILPDYLRKYAGINKKTIIAGLYNRLEIWDEKKWNSYKSETEKASTDIAEKLGSWECNEKRKNLKT
ncbi:MAG: division/cell wall cluster transcriptional repressor MraZ [Parcubacteria group bacterium]